MLMEFAEPVAREVGRGLEELFAYNEKVREVKDDIQQVKSLLADFTTGA